MRNLPSAPRAILVFALALVFLGCSAGARPSNVALQTRTPASPGQQILCPAALHVPFTLVGDPKADPPDWGVTKFDGHRFDIVWPAGFTARFDPDLEIVDPSGAVVARAGLITDAGGAGDDQEFGICAIGEKVYTH